ncbi:MAG TPA: hypothetical protein DCP11_00060, partial [Microbacteriaceae bacterium]|nr:hypothetical protein [Microbacteriaceae bacterium]
NAEFAPALRQVLIGLLIILFLKFRPQGLIPEKLNLDDRPPRGGFLSRLRRRPLANTPPKLTQDAATTNVGSDA